jgi:hypothetical protein
MAGFVDISGDEQRRIDQQLQRSNQAFLGAVDSYAEGQKTRRQRALEEVAMRQQLEKEAGRPLEIIEQEELSGLINQGKPFGSGMEQLYKSISDRQMGKEKAAAEEKQLNRQMKGQRQAPMELGENGMPKLNAEEKNKIGGIAEAFKSLSDMELAMDKGQGPRYIDPSTPWVGQLVSDDDFSTAQTKMTDIVGRLQSGGAITDDEGARFKNMGPRPGDSPTVRREKLKSQESFLANKLKAYGLDRDKLNAIGFDAGRPLGAGQINQNTVNAPGLMPANIPNMANAIPYAPGQAPLMPTANANQIMPEQLKGLSRAQKIQLAKQGGGVK